MFERATVPEQLGVSSAKLMEFIDDVEQRGIEIHSLILLRHGKEVCRMNWKPYDIASPHMLFSLSKSFTSCAVGFAVAEGLLSYDSRVADVLRDYCPEQVSERLARITLSDLLCMGSGLDPASDCAPDGPASDWRRHALSFEVTHEPGTHFNYNSFGTYLCSAMVTQVTGMSCRDYLMPRLFEPLGIAKPEWDACPNGISCGGWGLHLACEDIAKFGQLLLQKGMWNGVRVLPEGWVENATAAHIDNSGRNAHIDWEQGYGYQFWRCRDGRVRGDGMAGQYCIVSEREDAVLAMTAGVADMGAQMDAVHDYLFGAIDAAPGTDEQQRALKQRIATLEYAFPTDDGSGRDVSGRYVGEDGAEIELSFVDGDLHMRLQRPGDKDELDEVYGCGKPREGIFRMGFRGAPDERMLCGYGWQGGVLRTALRLVNGPFVRLDELTFDDDGLTDVSRGAVLSSGTMRLKKI